MYIPLPKISVVTITYGHQDYILDTLKGVLMQEYNGEIEFIIANDNSPDETHRVVTEFLNTNSIPPRFEIKYTKHDKNLGMMQNFIWALNQSKGKYIALCEGDDYWTDPFKLQKQVDFLECNKDVVMTYGNASIEDSTETYHKKDNYINGFTAQIITANQVIGLGLPTLTMVFRNVLTFPNWFSNVKSGDMFLRLLLSKHGDFYYHGETFGVHRKHEGGVSRTNDKLEWNLNSAKHLKLFLSDCHKNQKESVNKAIAKHYIYAFYTSLMNESSIKPLTLFFKCLSSKGFYTRQGIGLMRLLFKEVILKKNINILDIF